MARSMPARGNAPGTCTRDLLVELWRFLQFRVAVEIVLDPKLRVCFLQEGVDRHSTRTSLLLVELERRDAVQGQLRRTVRPRRSWPASRTKPGGPGCAQEQT